jgi:hypothetical protein
MRLLFHIKVDTEKLNEFNKSHYIIGDRAYLQNFIGLSDFWLLDEFGNLICRFENMLLDMVINLTSNYASLKKGEITEGGLFVMEAEWERHFTFIQEGNNYRIGVKDYRDLIIPKEHFYQFMSDFTEYALESIEFFYTGIKGNPNYIEWKNEIYNHLKAPL